MGSRLGYNTDLLHGIDLPFLAIAMTPYHEYPMTRNISTEDHSGSCLALNFSCMFDV